MDTNGYGYLWGVVGRMDTAIACSLAKTLSSGKYSPCCTSDFFSCAKINGSNNPKQDGFGRMDTLVVLLISFHAPKIPTQNSLGKTGLVEWIQKNNVNPFEWLRKVLEIIPTHKVNKLHELLPQNLEL
jgi:hypothetical protein